MKVKGFKEATILLATWIDKNEFLRLLAYNNRIKFKGAIKLLCKARGTRIVNGRAYYPQSQGSIEVANKIFKARLQATQQDTSIKRWV